MTDEKSHTEAAETHGAPRATDTRKNSTCALSGLQKRSGGHLDPIETTRATAGQFGHPADGGIVAADHSGDANKKVVALIERMERIVWNEYAHRDVLIHNCDLGQITFGDVRDLCDAVRAIPAAQPAPRVKADDAKAAPISLSYRQKLDALALRFYQGLAWEPKAGDYYTTSRADLELYQVVDVADGVVKTRYCDNKTTAIAQWDEAGFTTEGFGPKRVYVPDFVLSALEPSAQDGAEVELVTDADELRAELRRALAQIDSIEAECDRRHAQAEAERDTLKAEVERLRKALGEEQDSADEMADILSECVDSLMFDVDRLQAALDQHDALREAALRVEQKGDA